MLGTNDLLAMIGLKKYKRVSLFVPFVVYQKSYYFYLTFQKSLLKFDSLLSFIFSYAIDSFIQLVEEGHIVSIFDYIRLLKLMKNSMYDMVKISQKVPVPFVQITSIRFIVEELERRKIKGYNLKLFFEFFEENYKTYEGEKFMLSTESISRIIDRFVEFRINIQRKLDNGKSL